MASNRILTLGLQIESMTLITPTSTMTNIAIYKTKVTYSKLIPLIAGRMPNLCELYLSNNQLGNKEEIDWRWLLGLQVPI